MSSQEQTVLQVGFKDLKLSGKFGFRSLTFRLPKWYKLKLEL
jgi:hypothetical protein